MRTLACTWEVEVECRKKGAIGLFETRVFKVRATSSELAKLYARDDADDSGLEVRFVKQAEKMA